AMSSACAGATARNNKIITITYLIAVRGGTTVAAGTACSLPQANLGLPGFAPVLSGRSRLNPTSTGGGVGRGGATDSAPAATPLPVPPPQGGRERCVATRRNDPQ